MYNHPEGQSHPRAPKHLKRLRRHSFGYHIEKRSLKKIKNFLTKENLPFEDDIQFVAKTFATIFSITKTGRIT